MKRNLGNLLIVGSSGMIGSTLVEELHLKYPNYQVSTWNRSDRKSIECVLKEVSPDNIFYCSGKIGGNDITELILGNVTHLANLLELIKKYCPECRTIVLGSISVYGRVPKLPVSESCSIAPISKYGLSMQLRSNLIEYYRKDGLDVIEARLTNILGPTLSEKTSIGSFISQIKKAKLTGNINVGNLNTYRDFVDARDVANALIDISTCIKVPECVYAICSNKSVRISTVLQKLIKLSGKNLNVVIEPKLVSHNEIHKYNGSYQRLNSLCGWKPKYTLNETLKWCLYGS